MDFLRHLFGSGDYRPHGFCYLWDPGLVWLHVTSDILIAAAYFIIPLFLVKLVRKRRDIPFNWMCTCFGVFIVACGSTHIMEVWNLWHASYWLAGYVKAVTAVASLATAALMVRVVPKAIAMPSQADLRKSIDERDRELHDRLEAVKALRESEQRFRRQAALLDLAHDAIFVRDLRGYITYWNRGAHTLYGWSPEEAVGRMSQDLLSTEFPLPVKDIEQHALFNERWEGELVHRRRDGRRVVVASSWAVQRDDSGKPVAILEINTDITGRKAAAEILARANQDLEQRVNARTAELAATNEKLRAVITERERVEAILQASESRLRALVSSVDEVVYELGPDGIYLNVYTTDEILMGQPVEELVGLRVTDTMNEASSRAMLDVVQRVLASGVGENLEYENGSEKETRCFLARVTPIRAADGAYKSVCLLARDITDRRKLERQLIQSQKMEAVGQLAGGVAHDFNNLLGIILGYAEILEDEFKEGHDLHKPVAQIVKAGQSAASLTRQLLAFSRQQVLEPRVINLNSIVSDVEKLARRVIGEDIVLNTVLDPALGLAKADPVQIEQVILNLVVNSRDAMPDGGRIIIETSNVELDESYAAHRPNAQPGPYVLLAVTDTGAGMDAETQARAFDPFFTTKEKGKGTGLGLATVYGIVKQSGGWIWLYSELGQGTTLKIYLPRLSSQASSAQAKPEYKTLPRGSATILLVEDSEPLRALARETLESQGYKVLEASSGVHALQVAAKFVGTIDLLVSDLVMPEMGGRKLGEELLRVRPGVKTIFMTGYSPDLLRDSGSLETTAPLLNKPFTRRALIERVHSVLQAVPAKT
ncbi:MAG TPA: PAS domain S-box protein [Candidatus Acidoferrales bacterium]|nr:PAS domain S-box protein [Candidatus Acidoferrales bacterium]